jgi:hypothetical protein
MVNFFIHKSYNTRFTVLRRTQGLHAKGSQIELQKFCNATKLWRTNVLRGEGNVTSFFFNQLVDGVVHKLIQVE